MANVDIEARQDSSLMRPSDTPTVYGNHEKLTAHTGLQTECTIDEMIQETLEYWRNEAC